MAGVRDPGTGLESLVAATRRAEEQRLRHFRGRWVARYGALSVLAGLALLWGVAMLASVVEGHPFRSMDGLSQLVMAPAVLAGSALTVAVLVVITFVGIVTLPVTVGRLASGLRARDLASFERTRRPEPWLVD